MVWADGEGTFAVATLYRTVVDCWAAQRIKQDLPIRESRTGGDGQLLELLNEVRQALGDRWGIWEAIQYSIGSHAALPDGRVISYPEFVARSLIRAGRRRRTIDGYEPPWGCVLRSLRIHIEIPGGGGWESPS